MNWAVVMAGGRGTRFWPESRNRRPKPFLKLLGRRSLLEETVDRLSPLFPPERILVVLQADLAGEARRILKRIPPGNILGEPLVKNTAPCCVWAASWIEAHDPAAKFVFLPADQHIAPKALFQKTLRTAFDLADERPVLLAMKPVSPHTGFGYLEMSRWKKKINGISCFTVLRFHEKPGRAKAQAFLKRGNFFWNGGTFIWRMDAFKAAVRKYAPKIYRAWDGLSLSPQPSPPRPPKDGSAAAERGQGKGEGVYFRRLKRIYEKLPSISLDYAVMEKLKNVHGLLAPFQWNDLGGWEGLAEFWPKDSAANRVQGKALLVKSERNIVKAKERLVALLGVHDLLVVDTPDALLIAPRSRVEEIREVVRELERRKEKKYL